MGDSVLGHEEGSTAVTGHDPALDELRPELEVVRLLGAGTTARVYLARETGLQRLVALKVLRSELTADPVRTKRFEREAQAAARLMHTNVTAVYRVGRLSTGVPFIVMEYINGRTLDDVLESGGAFRADEGRVLLAAVAEALAAAHNHGIVHRDLRPNNVFIENRTGRAVLSDFGIAARIESGERAGTQLTAVGALLGDPQYTSPEQLRGEPATEQSDVYALGMLAYEVLTGRGPYDVKSAAQYMVAHLTQQPAPLRSLATLPPEPWVRALERCLEKEPNRRPRASELAAALAGPAAGAAPAADEKQTPVEQFFAEMRRRRVYKVLVGYGAAAIAVLGAAEVINDAFELPMRLYQAIVLITLGGFPLALGLSWIFDVSDRGIERTRAAASTAGAHRVLWLFLALTVLLVLAVGWLLLR